MRSLLLSCAALVLMTAACATTHDPAPQGTVSAAGTNLAPPVGKWRLAAFGDSDAVVAADVSLVVQEDGKLAGSGGCNSYFGTWTLGDGQDTLGPVGATRRLCQGEVMAVETRYFEVLSHVGGWRATDGGIVLTDTSGTAVLSFRAQD